MNQILVERSRRGMFVTLCYLLIDLSEGKIIVVNAGHLAPLVRQVSGKVVLLEGAANTPLGIVAEQTFSEHHFHLAPGEIITLMTDGILESMNKKGTLFGPKRINRILADATRGAEQTSKSIFSAVNRFAQGTPQHDDLTLICLRRKRTAKVAKAKAGKAKGKEERVALQVKSDPRYLALVRRNLEFMLAQDEVLDQDIQRIVLAVDEAAANVIRYAYQGDLCQNIDFTFAITPDWLTIKIRDYGQKPDLEKIKPRALEEIRPGGLGTRFMKEVMDEVNYDTSPPTGTLLTMKKRRSLSAGGK
jgi:sigma-B regulation protein RsbU (phosphoserine phosphatase)